MSFKTKRLICNYSIFTTLNVDTRLTHVPTLMSNVFDGVIPYLLLKGGL